MARDKEPKEPAADAKSDKKKGWTSAATVARNAASAYVPAYEAIVEAPKRIVMASAAQQKRGKTRFGFTMPKPLAYFQLDANYEHVLADARTKFKGKNDIKHIRYFADSRGDIKSSNLAVFERVVKDFDYCVDNFKSVLIDTTSELLDVRKLAEFGRQTQIMQIYYGGIYADFRWMVKRALDSNCNVNFVHRMKKEYRNDNWSGGFELEGWRGVMYETQVYVEHERDADGTFTTNVIECAQNALLMGSSLSSAEDENDFPTLATQIFQDTDKEDWA